MNYSGFILKSKPEIFEMCIWKHNFFFLVNFISTVHIEKKERKKKEKNLDSLSCERQIKCITYHSGDRLGPMCENYLDGHLGSK